jgi:hypothetical protein
VPKKPIETLVYAFRERDEDPLVSALRSMDGYYIYMLDVVRRFEPFMHDIRAKHYDVAFVLSLHTEDTEPEMRELSTMLYAYQGDCLRINVTSWQGLEPKYGIGIYNRIPKGLIGLRDGFTNDGYRQTIGRDHAADPVFLNDLLDQHFFDRIQQD